MSVIQILVCMAIARTTSQAKHTLAHVMTAIPVEIVTLTLTTVTPAPIVALAAAAMASCRMFACVMMESQDHSVTH